MNRNNALALLVHAVLPGSEALQVQSKTSMEERERLGLARAYPVFSATYKYYTNLRYLYKDGRPAMSNIETLDRFVKPISDLEVFAVECPDLEDEYETVSRPRWFWTDQEWAESQLTDQENANADLRAKIPSVEEDPDDKFRKVRESLESAKDCNMLVKARLEANLFEVTGPSLRDIIEDKELGKQIVTRWDGTVTSSFINYHHKPCTWANVLRLSFGVGCGYAMYDKISAQCDNEQIELEKNCRDDYGMSGNMHDENGLAFWNNPYMQYAVRILKKAKGATGMLIKYDYGDEVAIWELKKDTLTQKVHLN